MTGWLIALTLLVLFLLLKVGVAVTYATAAVIKLRIGLFRFSLPKTREKPRVQSSAAPKQRKKGLSPTLKKWLLSLWQNREDVLSLIARVLRSPTIDLLHLRLQVPDALTYGQICAGLSAGLPLLTNTFTVKKQELDVSFRPELSKLDIEVRVEATLRIYEIFALLGVALRLLWNLYQTTKKAV